MLKQLNKELIISTAFEEWGKSCYRNMSLTKIINKLKITKPALYRYFKNKKELLDIMRKILPLTKWVYRLRNQHILEIHWIQ